MGVNKMEWGKLKNKNLNENFQELDFKEKQEKISEIAKNFNDLTSDEMLEQLRKELEPTLEEQIKRLKVDY